MTKAQELGQLVVDNLPMFTQSSDLEVQERVCNILQIYYRLHHILCARGIILSRTLFSTVSL